jgi:hypothetical protein
MFVAGNEKLRHMIQVTLSDLQVCDDGILIQLSQFWTLSIVLSYLKHDVSDNGFCFHLEVEPTQVGPIEIDSLFFLLDPPE